MSKANQRKAIVLFVGLGYVVAMSILISVYILVAIITVLSALGVWFFAIGGEISWSPECRRIIRKHKLNLYYWCNGQWRKRPVVFRGVRLVTARVNWETKESIYLTTDGVLLHVIWNTHGYRTLRDPDTKNDVRIVLSCIDARSLEKGGRYEYLGRKIGHVPAMTWQEAVSNA